MTATRDTASSRLRQQRPRIHTTLLDLVWAVSQVTQDEQAIVATVAHVVNSGRARLTGTFKDARLVIG